MNSDWWNILIESESTKADVKQYGIIIVGRYRDFDSIVHASKATGGS